MSETPGGNSVVIHPNGPFVCDGVVEVVDAERNVIRQGTGIALCRCGASENKPFCDGSHAGSGFADDGGIAQSQVRSGEPAVGNLRVTLARNGPLLLDGPLELRSAQGDAVSGVKTALCRCGRSENKPFCDGSHARTGFSA